MEGVTDHRHCRVCGTPCAPGSDTCSTACAERRAAMISSRKSFTYLFYALVAFLLIVFLLSYLRP